MSSNFGSIINLFPSIINSVNLSMLFFYFQPGHSLYTAETNEFPLVLPVAR